MNGDTSRDQAQGLRRLFARPAVRFLPVVANPHVAGGGALLERLCTALGERGLQTLVVDAAETASPPHELALIDLAACIETLSADVGFLAARGLALHAVDAAGSTRAFLQRLLDAAPTVDAIVIHAEAAEHCRLFGHRRDGDERLPCPIVIADDRPASVTHAYASMKLLARRAGLSVTDLLLAVPPDSARAERIARQLAACAEGFAGASSRSAARVDPAGDSHAAPDDDLRRLVDAQLGARERGHRDGDMAPPRFVHSPARAAAAAYSRFAS